MQAGIGEIGAMLKKESIRITVCPARCAARIEKSLNKLEGVKWAAVNFATEKVTVEYDDVIVNNEQLDKVIEKLGYKVVREEEKGIDREKEQREKEISRLRIELVVSVILSAPLIMAMLLGLIGIGLPFLHNEYFQLIIATPVQFIIGFRFYKNAFHAVRSKGTNMDVLIAMGTSAAYFYSVYNTFLYRPNTGP